MTAEVKALLPRSDVSPPRCTDCDADCWYVESKPLCWAYDAAKGFCPWLQSGLAFPPQPSDE